MRRLILALALAVAAVPRASGQATNFALAVDNFSTTVATARSSGGGSLVLASSTGLTSPTGSHYYRLTIADATSKSVLTHLKVTGVSGTTLTIAGTLDGYSDPATIPVGALAYISANAGTLVDIQGAVNAIQSTGINTPPTGLVKSDGTTYSAAVAGTDYLVPTGNGSGLIGLVGTQITGNIAGNAAGLTAPIAESQVTGLTTDLAAKAPLASPALTGTPTAPTPSTSDSSTTLATTAYVKAQGGGTVQAASDFAAMAPGQLVARGAAGAVRPFRVNRSRAIIATVTPSGTGLLSGASGNIVTSRTPFAPPYDTAGVEVEVGNYSVHGAGAADAPGTEYVRVKATLEYPAATFTPLYFPGGGRYQVLEPGGSARTNPSGILVAASGPAFVRIAWESLGISGRHSVAVTGAPTGGTFTLSIGGSATSTLNWNATSAQVQAAVAAIAGVGVGNVLVTGGPAPANTFYINWVNGLAYQVAPTVALGTNSLTGGASPGVTVVAIAAGALPAGKIPTNATNFGSDTTGAVFGSDLCDSGTIAAGTGFWPGPVGIYGSWADPTVPTLLSVGDSITAGNNDSNNGYDNSGWQSRACKLLSPNLAQHQIAKSGHTLALEVTTSSMQARSGLYGSCSHNLLALGVNDLGPGSQTTIEANYVLYCRRARAMGEKVIIATITPDTTSTDVYVTTTNQTIANAANNTARVAANNWIRSPTNQAANGFQCLDIADAAESARDSGLWAAPNGGGGTNALGTPVTSGMSDAGGGGLHPSPYGYGVLATYAAGQLPALLAK